MTWQSFLLNPRDENMSLGTFSQSSWIQNVNPGTPHMFSLNLTIPELNPEIDTDE